MLSSPRSQAPLGNPKGAIGSSLAVQVDRSVLSCAGWLLRIFVAFGTAFFWPDRSFVLTMRRGQFAHGCVSDSSQIGILIHIDNYSHGDSLERSV